MYQARLGCFETNSSSTHGLVIVTDYEHSQYKLGNLYVNFNNMPDLPRCGTFECYKSILINPDKKYDKFRDEWLYEYRVNGDVVEFYDKDYSTNSVTKLEGEDLDDAIHRIMRSNGIITRTDSDVYESYAESYPTPDGKTVLILEADWET